MLGAGTSTADGISRPASRHHARETGMQLALRPRMNFLARCLVASLTTAALVGCGQSSQSVTMADAFDLDIFGPHTDDLHTPYVAGASFEITVTNAASGGDETGWTLSSSDQDVIRVTSPLSGGGATVTAGNPGQATLSVLDASGAVRDSHTVSVAIPDQVSLYAQGLLLTGASDPAAQVTQASIVTGGEATFLARYFLQGTELYGNGALQSSATGGVTTATVSPSFASDRDFLEVTLPPGANATGTVSLFIDHVAVGEIPVQAVDPESITQVTILPQPTDNPKNGDSLVLYAHAVDATSTDVYGASFSWLVDGQPSWSSQPGDGGFVESNNIGAEGPADLFFYTFDSTVIETVAASYDSFTPRLQIHGQGGSVGSTADVGCNVGAPGAGGTSAAGIALALAFVLAARRRRVGG